MYDLWSAVRKYFKHLIIVPDILFNTISALIGH